MQVQFSFMMVSVLCLLSISACSEKLDRDSASDVIRKEFPKNIIKSFDIRESAFGADAILDRTSGDFSKRDKEIKR